MLPKDLPKWSAFSFSALAFLLSFTLALAAGVSLTWASGRALLAAAIFAAMGYSFGRVFTSTVAGAVAGGAGPAAAASFDMPVSPAESEART